MGDFFSRLKFIFLSLMGNCANYNKSTFQAEKKQLCETKLQVGELAGFCVNNFFTTTCVRDMAGEEACFRENRTEEGRGTLPDEGGFWSEAEPRIARPQGHRRWPWGNALIIFNIFLINFFFFSCSNSVPNILNTDCTVVFTYENEKKLPDARLSVFLQPESDVRRCEMIKVKAVEAKFLWETKKIRKIASGNVQWAGNCNFVVPEGDKIPQGLYEITYINADEQQQNAVAHVNYDEKIYELLAEDVPEYVKNKGTLNYSIFSSDDVLIFYGEPGEDFSTKADILDRYNNASYYKEVWVANDNSAIFILPKKQL